MSRKPVAFVLEEHASQGLGRHDSDEMGYRAYVHRILIAIDDARRSERRTGVNLTAQGQ